MSSSNPVSDRIASPATGAIIPQVKETTVKRGHCGPFLLRYFYARSSEKQEKAETGEDYIYFKDLGRRIGFAVCDGVTGSYVGDIAASFLGEKLVDWLLDSRNVPALVTKESISKPLGVFLDELANDPEKSINLPPVPGSLTGIHRRVIESKRKNGSETVFACGLIELPITPTSESDGRIILAWMGNTELQVWTLSDEREMPIDLKAKWDDNSRWSTRLGQVKGPPQVRILSSHNVVRVVAYSDGLKDYREVIGKVPSDTELERMIRTEEGSPQSDDLSFLEIMLPLSWSRMPDAGLAQPQPLFCEIDGNVLRVDWLPVGGADHYSLELIHEHQKAAPIRVDVKGPPWSSTVDLYPGKITVRVQAVNKAGLRSPPATAMNYITQTTVPSPSVGEFTVRLSRLQAIIATSVLLLCFLLASASGFVAGRSALNEPRARTPTVNRTITIESELGTPTTSLLELPNATDTTTLSTPHGVPTSPKGIAPTITQIKAILTPALSPSRKGIASGTPSSPRASLTPTEEYK